MTRHDIFFDPVCPWCLIGKANLDRALEARPNHPFAIAWHPFRLEPDLPREGVPLSDYLDTRFGSREQAVKVMMAATQMAARIGIEIDFARIPRMPNTLDAHRLVHWAGIEGRQSRVVSRLLHAYWREGRDIGSAETLIEIATQTGMDGDQVGRLLASDADTDDLIAREADARAKGVQSVPTFLVAQRHVVSGAQPPELWMQVIDELTGRPE